MGWGEPHQPPPDVRTRADLARELDLALHGEQTIRHPVTPDVWIEMLAEVSALAAPRTCPDCHIGVAAGGGS